MIRSTIAAVVALASATAAVAAPVDFTLQNAGASFFGNPYTFGGTFTFDAITETASNLDIAASPINPANPVIVPLYNAEGGLCDVFGGTGILCATNSANTAAISFQFLAPLDGIINPDQIIDINATVSLSSPVTQDSTEELTGSAITGSGETPIPEPGMIGVFFASAIALAWWGRKHAKPRKSRVASAV